MKSPKNPFASGPRDERISAQLGPIYRTGFLIMVGGILFDLYTRYNYLARTGDGSSLLVENPLEWAVLMAACLTVAVMSARRGVVSDSLRFTEARTFAETGMIPLGIGGALLVSVAAVGGRLYNEIVLFGLSEVTWAGDFAMFIVMMAMFTPLILAVLYLTWKSYRTKEDRLASEDD